MTISQPLFNGIKVMIQPRFGSRAGSFLTQRRKGAEKIVFLCFLKVIFIFATPHHRHPMAEDSFRRKNSRIFHFSHYFTFSLRYFASLRLCVEINSRF
jgi:hypothetical protein